MTGSDDNGNSNGANRTGWSWRFTARTWVLIATFIIGLVPVALRACGVKPTQTELPPVNTGFNSNAEAQKAANDAKQLANLINQMNTMQHNSNSNQSNSNGKAAPKR